MAENSKPKTVHFSIEVAEKERLAEIADREPFTVDIHGRTISMIDPKDIDWRDLAGIEHPLEFLKYCVSREDREFLRTQPITGAVFNKMIEAYQRYYGLETPGNAAGLRF